MAARPRSVGQDEQDKAWAEAFSVAERLAPLRVGGCAHPSWVVLLFAENRIFTKLSEWLEGFGMQARLGACPSLAETANGYGPTSGTAR